MSVEALKGQVRDLSTTYRSGQPKAFEAVRELAMLLLRLTIAHPYAHLMFVTGPNKLVRTLGVPGMPLPLNNGRFLRITAVLSLEETEHGTRLKVRNSGYQYQSDVDGDKWIIRYDYLRTPKDQHPGAHVQVNGELREDCCPEDRPFPRIHIPTGRISIEAVIRLLAEQFEVPCNTAPEVWRPVLAESEALFHQIAHKPLSGPVQ